MDPGEFDDELAELVEGLQQVRAKGVRAAQLRGVQLTELACVRGQATPSDSAMSRAQVLEAVMREVLARLGAGDVAEATRLLFGIDPGTAGMPLRDRRSSAASYLAIAPETLRKKREPKMLLDVAAELFMLNHDFESQLSLMPASVPPAASHDWSPPEPTTALPVAARHRISIREAVEDDRDFVIALMEDSLSPFYGGDHRAHAERILATHLAGGRDHIGHFSFEQRMFIAESDGVRAGMIHIVGKRQETYKVSPLIVTPAFRRGTGVGTSLLEWAQHYADSHGARQLYCTVADSNTDAREFFLRHGFVPAGSSDSHYQVGTRETMMYKPLQGDDPAEFDRIHISVVPCRDKDLDQVRALLLKELPRHFLGVDDQWVDSLFAGYRRRQLGDVNVKYKLLYVALDRGDTVLGVAGATPKKGEPIKLMPLVATDLAAFVALLSDLPYQLKPRGRKLYAHLASEPDQVAALQRHGWVLDGAMPGAYQPGVVTYQWSLNIEESVKMRTMRVKDKYLSLIESGDKPLEVRVRYNTIASIRQGDPIHLASGTRSLNVVVADVREYATFEEMLRVEDASQIIPGATGPSVLSTLRDIYPADRERLGVVVLELRPQPAPQSSSA